MRMLRLGAPPLKCSVAGARSAPQRPCPTVGYRGQPNIHDANPATVGSTQMTRMGRKVRLSRPKPYSPKLSRHAMAASSGWPGNRVSESRPVKTIEPPMRIVRRVVRERGAMASMSVWDVAMNSRGMLVPIATHMGAMSVVPPACRSMRKTRKRRMTAVRMLDPTAAGTWWCRSHEMKPLLMIPRCSCSVHVLRRGLVGR